jgi:5-methylcytosine-specific restriction endonuclease McrA
MIRLTKGEPPQVLVDNAETWTEEYRRLREAGQAHGFSRHRHPDVKAAVLTETAEKCAFCESKMRHVAFGDVEHVLPKSARPDLVVEWTNLTLACSVCNNNKGDYYHEDAPIIHPYHDEPQHHLVFVGPMVTHARRNALGERTHRRLELNRIALLERRADRLSSIKELVDRLDALEPGPDRALFENEIRKEGGADAEYAAAVRDFLASHFDAETGAPPEEQDTPNP